MASLPDPTSGEAMRWAMFLDIDGTLVDIAITPNAVTVPPMLPTILDGWQFRLRGALALISGRTLSQIDGLFHPQHYDAAGSHGQEWRQGGLSLLAVSDRSAEIAAVTGFARQLVEECPGLALERKTYSLVVHYRAAPDKRPDAERIAERIAARLGTGFRCINGKAVVEILPDGTDKAAAVSRFMNCAAYRGRQPVFAGDDISDEVCFELVNQMGGVSIHVGNNPSTKAMARLPSPTSLREWLASAVIPRPARL